MHHICRKMFTGKGICKTTRYAIPVSFVFITTSRRIRLPCLYTTFSVREATQERIGNQISLNWLHAKDLNISLFIDTFTRWREAFPTSTERAQEVSKQLLKEISPRFSLPRSLQCDNGPSFTSHITQQGAKALGIRYFLHSSKRPQSTSKVEKKQSKPLSTSLGSSAKKPPNHGLPSDLRPTALLRVLICPQASLHSAILRLYIGGLPLI